MGLGPQKMHKKFKVRGNLCKGIAIHYKIPNVCVAS